MPCLTGTFSNFFEEEIQKCVECPPGNNFFLNGAMIGQKHIGFYLGNPKKTTTFSCLEKWRHTRRIPIF